MTQKLLFEKRATAVGFYWRSSCDKGSVRQYLRDCALTRYKEASIGGEQESGFEQAFSSLAYAYLKDKSPRLLDFIVGFQLVDRNEDNTKAVGVFGFKVGDQWLYAPCFFLNGDLKGHELLYIKKQDAFVPMKENWVNYLISRKPNVLGEGSDQNTHQLGGLMPSLSRLVRPPIGNKYGSDATLRPEIQEWSTPFIPFAMSMMLKQAKALYPEHVKTAGDNGLNFKAIVDAPFKAAMAATASKFDLRNFLGEFPLLKSAFEQCYMRYPLIKKGFDRFYGESFFTDMAHVQKQAVDSLVSRAQTHGLYSKQAASYIVPPKKKPKKSDSLIPEEEVKQANDGLTIFVLDGSHAVFNKTASTKVDEDAVGTITQNLPDLDDNDREKLLKDTVLIKDERDPHKKSMAYNTQVRLDLSNPDQTGLFDVLEKPSKFDEMVVLVNPYSGRGEENFCTVIRKSDPRAWKNTSRNNLYHKQNRQPTDTDYKKWVEGLEGVSSLKKGGTYIALNANGGCTCPFRVKEDNGDGQYRVDWQDHVAWNERSWRNTKDLGSYDDSDLRYSSWDAKVWINQRKGCKLRAVNGELSIPDDFKILKLKDPPKPKKEKDDCLVGMACGPLSEEQGESRESPVMPGNLSDVQLMLHKEAQQLKLTDIGGNEVWVRSHLGGERMGKKAALISLVRDHGLGETQAREMLKEAAACAARQKPAIFLVKYAFGYPLQPGPSAPAIPEPMRGVEMNGYNSVASQYPQEEFMPVDEMSSHQTDPNIYDPFYQPDQGAMQVAQQAAQSGQKEVFDTAMIGGMLKSVRQDSLVDKYLGDLMKALDKLGRILFMFYWHQEEFEDRYGKQDLPELEDSLRNAFEVMGDVCLFLKEKTVQGAHGVDMGQSVGSGAPSIDEAARN